MLAWPSAIVKLSSVFSVKQNESTLKSQNDSKQNPILKKKSLSIISCFLFAVQLSYFAYVCNATDSFIRRKWNKRNPSIAKCVINFIVVQLSEIEQTEWDFSFGIFLFAYVIISPPIPPRP